MLVAVSLLPSDGVTLFKYLALKFEYEKKPWSFKHIAISSFVSSVWFLIFKAGAKNCFECHVDVQDAYVSEDQIPVYTISLACRRVIFVLDLKLIDAPSKSFASS